MSLRNVYFRQKTVDFSIGNEPQERAFSYLKIDHRVFEMIDFTDRRLQQKLQKHMKRLNVRSKAF